MATLVISDEELHRLTWLLEEALRSAPKDISEHELFEMLAARGEQRFDRSLEPSEHALFRAHFILFHTLHRLRETWRHEKKCDLEINCLGIGVRPFANALDTALTEYDRLSAYYLDIDNLQRTTAEDVHHMLDDFWRHFSRSTRRAEALAALGLDENANDDAVKRRYRRLAFACHPDRGGNHDALLKLNQAMAILKR